MSWSLIQRGPSRKCLAKAKVNLILRVYENLSVKFNLLGKKVENLFSHTQKSSEHPKGKNINRKEKVKETQEAFV